MYKEILEKLGKIPTGARLEYHFKTKEEYRKFRQGINRAKKKKIYNYVMVMETLKLKHGYSIILTVE